MEEKTEFDQEEITGLAFLASIGFVIAFFVPEFLAQETGWQQAHDQLVAWARTKELWLFISLFIVYEIFGFLVLVSAVFASGTIGYVLFLGVKEATIWTAKGTVFLMAAIFTGLAVSAVFVLKILIWPFRFVADFVKQFALSSTASLRQRWAERQELRRLYREEFADEFDSFKEFKRRLNDPDPEEEEEEEKARPQEPPKVDPYAASIRLLGLTDNFTRKDLEDRYRKLMRGVHPDVAGPNELATQINQARDLIKRRKGWK